MCVCACECECVCVRACVCAWVSVCVCVYDIVENGIAPDNVGPNEVLLEFEALKLTECEEVTEALSTLMLILFKTNIFLFFPFLFHVHATFLGMFYRLMDICKCLVEKNKLSLLCIPL